MSNIVETNIVLDLNRSAVQTIYAKQYDNDTRSIKIEVVNQGNHVNINELGYVVYFKGKASNGRNVLQHCTVDENDIVSIELTANILHVAGHLNGELLLVDSHSGTWDETNNTFSDSAVVSTMPFILHVKASTFEDEEVPEEEVSLLNDLIAEVTSVTTDISELEERIEDNEETRISNENTRIANENTRIANEENRASAEATRASNETTRQSNEQTRQTNENTRQTNETSRIETMEQIETDLQTLENELDTVVLKRQLGVPSTSTETGVATLDTNGQVPESQLPSYVDDVLEGRAQNVTQSASGAYSATAFILKGESTACVPEEDKIYIDTADLIQYRWSGSVFVSVGSHLALGETSSTAFPGNRGKAIEDDYLSKTGNADDTTVTFTESTTRTNITSGEKASVLFGKIKKFFADLKTVAFTGNASDVSFDNTGTTSSSTTVQAGLKEALTNSAPTASDVPYTNTTSGLSATNVQGAIDEVSEGDLIKNLLHPIGTIIESTTCDTMAKVVEAYGGTTWIQHSGYVLRGASSGVTANDAQKTGGSDDAIVVNHSHTFMGSTVWSGPPDPPKTGGISANHYHGIPALSGTAYAVGDHSHEIGGVSTGTKGSNQIRLSSYAEASTTRTSAGAGSHSHSVVTDASNTGYVSADHTHSLESHQHQVTCAGTVGSNGSSGTNANMMNYKSVYIWERTA